MSDIPPEEEEKEAGAEQKKPEERKLRVPKLEETVAEERDDAQLEDLKNTPPPPTEDQEEEGLNPRKPRVPILSDDDDENQQDPLSADTSSPAADENQQDRPAEDARKVAPDNKSSFKGKISYVSSSESDLKIGDDLGLTNKDPTLKTITVGAGWDIRSMEGISADLDLSVFILNTKRKTRRDEDFIFYNNLKSAEGEVIHRGDSRDGVGDGDDEQIDIDLYSFPFDVASIMIVLSIHDGDIRDQDFSCVRNAFVRILNAENGQMLCKLEIPDDFLESNPGGHAMKVGEIFRDGPKWRFFAGTEIPKKSTLRSIATEYGIIVV